MILSSGVHYTIQRINYRNDLARIDRFVSEARSAAWGPRMVPLEGKRKVRPHLNLMANPRELIGAGCDQVRVNMGGRAYLDEDGNVVPGRQLDMVVEGNDVFIVRFLIAFDSAFLQRRSYVGVT